MITQFHWLWISTLNKRYFFYIKLPWAAWFALIYCYPVRYISYGGRCLIWFWMRYFYMSIKNLGRLIQTEAMCAVSLGVFSFHQDDRVIIAWINIVNHPEWADLKKESKAEQNSVRPSILHDTEKKSNSECPKWVASDDALGTEVNKTPSRKLYTCWR